MNPSVLDVAADYVLFTDRPVPPNSVWQVRDFDFVHSEPALTVAFVKLHPQLYLPHHDVAIWVDGAIRLDAVAEAFLSAEDEASDIIAWHGLAEAPMIAFRPKRPAAVAFLAEWWRLIDTAGSEDRQAFAAALRASPGLVVGHFGRKDSDWRGDPRLSVVSGDRRGA